MTEENDKTWHKLKDILNEHLDGFCLIGYTLDGSRIRVLDYSTEIQEDALDTLMEDALRSHKVPNLVQVLTEEEGEKWE